MRFLSLMTAFLLLPICLFSQNNHSLEVQVVAQGSKENISSAKVSIVEIGQENPSNLQGKVRFTGLSTGTYTVIVEKEGYIDWEQTVELDGNVTVKAILLAEFAEISEILISSTRATDQTATTYSELTKKEVQEQNFGQDLPFLLNRMPSTVATSDAGAGIGYTALRIRGSDPTRTNITINDVPLNDPESHFTFLVNLPDFASSVQSLQVQRGVGTSTNGAGAFGASVNIQTTNLSLQPYAEFNNSYGSFNSWKNTLSAGTGLIEDKFALDVRLSKITSDGFVDRASSDLKSFFVSGSYLGKKSQLKLNIFSGKEVTYQSWYGLPESKLTDDRTYNFYTYDNEVDNYQQDHYQLQYTANPSNDFTLKVGLHYTKGRGYFEQFRADDDLADYGLANIVLGDTSISSSDIIRRRWLDNDFYGATYAFNYQANEKLKFTLGGAWNQYDGDHFGEVIWARYASSSDIRDRYYESRGFKTDFNTYFKTIFQATDNLSAYIDLQYRLIGYQFGDSTLLAPGKDNDGQAILGDYTYQFFNPKFGLTYQLSPQQQAYASFSIGNREPVRNDFTDAPEGRTPEHETLRNLEIGYRMQQKKVALQVNYFLMDYTNQLVINGELNDVGAALRQNVPDSYRMGVEVDGKVDITPTLSFSANAAISQNKIKEFSELIYQYDADFNFIGTRTVTYEDTDIALSPNLIGGATLSYRPIKGLDISLLSKYVSRQYLDNTNQESRSIDPFWVNDLRIWYSFQPSWAKEIRIGFLLNNFLNETFEANGYTYNYEYAGQLVVENFYYPQAGTNYFVNIGVRF